MHIEGFTLIKAGTAYYAMDKDLIHGRICICTEGFEDYFGCTPRKIKLHWTDKWSKYVVMLAYLEEDYWLRINDRFRPVHPALGDEYQDMANKLGTKDWAYVWVEILED